jgi:hypothetical protein
VARPRENGVGYSRNIARLHPDCRREIENIQYGKYQGKIPFTQASRELVEQKKELEQENKQLQKRIEELISVSGRRNRLL